MNKLQKRANYLHCSMNAISLLHLWLYDLNRLHINAEIAETFHEQNQDNPSFHITPNVHLKNKYVNAHRYQLTMTQLYSYVLHQSVDASTLQFIQEQDDISKISGSSYRIQASTSDKLKEVREITGISHTALINAAFSFNHPNENMPETPPLKTTNISTRIPQPIKKDIIDEKTSGKLMSDVIDFKLISFFGYFTL